MVITKDWNRAGIPNFQSLIQANFSRAHPSPEKFGIFGIFRRSENPVGTRFLLLVIARGLHRVFFGHSRWFEDWWYIGWFGRSDILGLPERPKTPRKKPKTKYCEKAGLNSLQTHRTKIYHQLSNHFKFLKNAGLSPLNITIFQLQTSSWIHTYGVCSIKSMSSCGHE